MMKELTENLQMLIGENKLSKVFDLLERNFKGTDYISEITLQKSNFNHLKKQERQDLINLAEANLRRNKIVNGLLGLLDDIKESRIRSEGKKQENSSAQTINIVNSKNVNTGNVNTSGGDFTIGDSK